MSCLFWIGQELLKLEVAVLYSLAGSMFLEGVQMIDSADLLSMRNA